MTLQLMSIIKLVRHLVFKSYLMKGGCRNMYRTCLLQQRVTKALKHIKRVRIA